MEHFLVHILVPTVKQGTLFWLSLSVSVFISVSLSLSVYVCLCLGNSLRWWRYFSHNFVHFALHATRWFCVQAGASVRVRTCSYSCLYLCLTLFFRVILSWSQTIANSLRQCMEILHSQHRRNLTVWLSQTIRKGRTDTALALFSITCDATRCLQSFQIKASQTLYDT